MHSVQTGMWDPRPPSKHASTVPVPPSSNSRLAHVTTATPAKRITFYKSGDSQFGGIRMAIHKRSFKCFDTLLDDLSQKVPLPFGVRTVTTPRGTHSIRHLEQLQDGACYLCSDRRQAKPINLELASKRPTNWYHHSRRPQRPETSSTMQAGHTSYRQRRILLVKNSEPGMRRSVVLSRRSARSLRAFLDEVSEVMQFHVRKLYTAEGRRIDSVQSLITCPGVLVCVGREAFSPLLIHFIRKSSEEKLPGLGSRTPGNGARSPATQGARSPHHGAQSRASEYSEGQESKKNVNFGLETKKSIIHPRSDSSNRSTRFSLSSDKSYGNGITAYSQARPAIMNDDIEKRVLVNKDGSLSVEMRVRFRLHNDETVQWSTQIKKSPSLTNDSCPLSQAEPHYLQQGQSESCSDPDSTSFDREPVDYSSQPLQRALETNHCPCCYQRRELPYDLWENPAHSPKHPPVPPPHPHTHNHTHTIMRHTHSSSSSSSCNSRRVVRCRAQLSSRRGGSGSEQSQLVQEEMCVVEQVEHRVDVEQDGDPHVEMCTVSRSCSRGEAVAMDSDLRAHSRKSVEDEIEEEEGERSVSAISSSSHILQSLKEDRDDEDEELPPSASQCCHCSQPAAFPTCTAGTPHSAAGTDNMEQASSSMSKTSGAKIPQPEEEVAADDADEEVKRIVSGFSGYTGSQKSGASNVCSVCGGCKRELSSVSESRASQRSQRSHPASQNPASPASNNGRSGSDDDGSDHSAVSTQSNKTNLTHHGCLTNGQEARASSAMLRITKPASVSSAASHRSKRSHNSDRNGATGVTVEKEERSPSTISAQSIRSAKSNCSGTAESPNFRTAEQEEGEDALERVISSLSAKSGVSAQTGDSVKSHKYHCQPSPTITSPTDKTVAEEQGDANIIAPSSLSVKSNNFAKSGKAERPNSNISAKSSVTTKSGTSHTSTCSNCAKAGSPGAKVAIRKDTGQEEGTEVKERPVSTKSNLSVKSCKSTKPSERSPSPRSEAERDGEERAASKMSARSVKSNMCVKSSKSCKSDCNDNKTEACQSINVSRKDEEKENNIVDVEMQQRPESSTGSSTCNGDTRAASQKQDNTGDCENAKTRAASALSATSAVSHHSAISEKSQTSAKSQKSNHIAACSNQIGVSSIGGKEEEMQNDCEERVASAMSVKSKCSAKSGASHKSNSGKAVEPVSPSHNMVTIEKPEENEATERTPSAASTHQSNHSGPADVPADADVKVVEDDAPRINGHADSGGQMLSPRGRSPRTRSPKASAVSHKSSRSPAQLLPGGETRGPSALSVQSTTSAKSGRSKCCCGASLVKRDKESGDREVVNEEMKTAQASERAASIMSSSSKKQRRESGGTEQPLSRNSSGSISLGLPEDQETAESHSGKSSSSFKDRVKCPDVPSVINDLEESLPAAADIPTIEPPVECKYEGEEGGEQNPKRTASANSARSSSSYKSNCKCSIKAAAQILDSRLQETHSSVRPNKEGNDLETQSVKSASTKEASSENRTSTTVSRRKNKIVATTESENNGTENQAAEEIEHTMDNSPRCLRPESAASAQAKQSKGESPATGHNSKSKSGSSSCSINTPNPHKKETAVKSPRKVETCSESTLSHSLSAADLLRETKAAARPRSCQSKVSKSSDKVGSEKSARCQRSRKQTDQVEELQVTPACLPNASPNDVVSEWLRSIPANSSMLALDDELHELKLENEMEEKPAEEVVAQEEEVPEGDSNLDKEQKAEAQEEAETEGEKNCDAAEEAISSDDAAAGDAAAGDAAAGDAVGTTSCPNTLLLTGMSLPRNWHPSAAVMKVLLSSSLGRCHSMPEVSPVYGRRLSTSARGLLDCLAQLQLIEPALSPVCEQHKYSNQQYEDIMAILQSLWLSEPWVTEAKEAKEGGGEQVTPPRSSSGVGMSSGSGGSGKENGNQGEDDATPKETESVHEGQEAEKAVAEEEEGNADEMEVAPEDTSTKQATIERLEESVQNEEQGALAPSLDSPKPAGNPSSSDKSSANDSSKSPTDNEQETLEDSSSGTPPTVLRAPLIKRLSQDPDPVWVLHLLKKLEKQFINHYIDAMAEFKVRWDLDDSLILNTMIKELRDEVSRRIQSSIEREMRKIQSRVGRVGRSPRPPQGRNLSRESTMTEKRRRMLKVMKNQSVKTADSLSDEDIMGDFSDQRSDDDYCPCDACVRKKMAARPFKANPMAVEAPVMMEFDLLKILQLKKSPLPADVPQHVEVDNDDKENNLEVVEEEEEEDETKADIKADVLEEMIPEEEMTEEGSEAGEEEGEVGGEEEGNSVENEVQEKDETGEEVQEDEASENGEQEEEGEAECHCHSDKEGEGDRDTEREAEETSNNTTDEEERAGEEEGVNAEDEEETGNGEGEEESDKDTVKEATADEGEISGDGECEEEMEEREAQAPSRGGEEEASGETEDDSPAKSSANEESSLAEEFAGGNVSTSAEAEDEGEEGSHDEDEKEGGTTQQRASPDICVTEGEDADAEDSDTDHKPSAETSHDEPGREGAGTTGDEEEKEGAGHKEEEEVVEDAVEEFKPNEEDEEEEMNGDAREEVALLHQFTRTSVESQPGSMEDIDTDSPQNSMEVPKTPAGVSTAGGTSQGRSGSSGRLKRHNPKTLDNL